MMIKSTFKAFAVPQFGSRLFLTFTVVLTSLASASSAQEVSANLELEKYLDLPPAERPELSSQSFANLALTKEQSDVALQLLWADLKNRIRIEREKELENRELVLGEHKLKFAYRVLGDPPQGGRSLFISMHGGGNAPPRVNDRQWENQKTLYSPDEGVYVAPPRANEYVESLASIAH